MSAAAVEQPRVIHDIPGRMRVSLPDAATGWTKTLAARLREAPGVLRAQVSEITHNALIYYDPGVTTKQALLRQITELATRGAIPQDAANMPSQPQRASTPRTIPVVTQAQGERHAPGRTLRARIPVRGIETNPRFAQHVVERLRAQRGVSRAMASPLTGRVLVEFTEHETEIDDLLAQLADLDLPDIPDEDQPTHPLDPGPLIQGSARTAATVAGLGIVALKQFAGIQDLLIPREVAGQTANVIGIMRGFPAIRNGARGLLGPDAADLTFTLPNLAALALSDNPLGLLVSGVESLRLLTEVIARRRAWKKMEARVEGVAPAQPGMTFNVETGERLPLDAEIVDGYGTAIERDGQPGPVSPGRRISAGAKLFGGPFSVRLLAGEAFNVANRPAPPHTTLYQHYMRAATMLSLGFAALTGIWTRSLARTIQALVVVSPRTAIIGMEAASLDASARVLRGGVTVVGTRPDRVIQRPDVLLLDSARLLVDGYEIASVVPLTEGVEVADLITRASVVARAAGSPWGGVFRASGTTEGSDGRFDGTAASATIYGETYQLGPLTDWEHIPAALRLQQRGHYLLELRGERQGRLAILVLRPRLARGAADLARTAERLHVKIGVLADAESLTARDVAHRAGIPVIPSEAVPAIRALQQKGAYVAFASDSSSAGSAFAACDMAIGVVDPRGQMLARADLLAPDLVAVAAILDAGARRDAAVRDSVGFSAITNGLGIAWGMRGNVGIQVASRGMYTMVLASLADGWLRTRGGERPPSVLESIPEPRPERWGRMDIADVIRSLNSSPTGLTSAQAEERRQVRISSGEQSILLPALVEQFTSPLTLILGGSAVVALLLGSVGNAAIIGATVIANSAVAAWQERQVGKATEALERMGTARARVLRDGEEMTILASDLVPGDVLVLQAGDRVTADARLIQAQNLEVDEAALTGESLAASKHAEGGSDASRIVLEGSDVTVGSARAVVVAVGRYTRMGATAAALATGEMRQSAIGMRLSRMLWQTLPFAAIAGVVVTGSGLLRGRALATEIVMGITVALAVLPESLPVLAQVGEAGVARRLASRQALVRRLSAVEALGRVDVACADKTGTLTKGHLALHLVATSDDEVLLPGELAGDLGDVLLVAALASPHPEDPGVTSHPTDIAVIRGAQEAGLNGAIYAKRDHELPFDPVRAFAAAVIQGRLCVKGAPEVLLARCASVRAHGETQPLDEQGRAGLLEQAQRLASRGLRVLLAAEGRADIPVDDPHDLVALGFIGISDPLRPNARAAVRTCQAAGIRVIMLTGDHPATARAIAREAGLLDGDEEVLTGADIAELHNGDLDERLERASVIARATPLDKLRIVESLQRHHHIVAMTGDGVNDAPALRLADVGVAMGRGGTEVARQTADLVLMDDDFATLVDALVEGRSYWHNVRRALGLLVGGNLGELGLLVGMSLLGSSSLLSTRQILGVNLVTDVFPGVAVALQQPENHDLSALAREGQAALGKPLRNDLLRRAGATAVPTLAASLAALGVGGAGEASVVAYTSLVTTQLIQTLDAGYTDEGWNRSMVAAVVGSGGLLAASLAVPPLRSFFQLAMPSPLGWALTAGATASALLASRLFSPVTRVQSARQMPRLLTAPAT